MKKTIIVILLLICGSLIIYSFINTRPLVEEPSQSRIVLVMLGEEDITQNITENQKRNILDTLRKYRRCPSTKHYATYKVNAETIEISLVDQNEKTLHLVMGDVTFCYTDYKFQYKIQNSENLFKELREAISTGSQ